MKKINIKSIILNKNNPRRKNDESYQKLVQSIKDFPKMMELRPIVIGEDNVVLGGNMRLKALKDLGYKEIPTNWIKLATDLTEDEQKEFIIKDNLSFGLWDYEILKADFSTEDLYNWGLEMPDFLEDDDINLDDFFEETDIVKAEKFKLILEYTEDEYNFIMGKLSEIGGSKEDIIYKLLDK